MFGSFIFSTNFTELGSEDIIMIKTYILIVHIIITVNTGNFQLNK